MDGIIGALEQNIVTRFQKLVLEGDSDSVRFRATPDDSERLRILQCGPTFRSRFRIYRSRIGVDSGFLPNLPITTIQAFETAWKVPRSRTVSFATGRRSMRGFNPQITDQPITDSWSLGDSLIYEDSGIFRDSWILEESTRDSNHSRLKIHMNESVRKIHVSQH